MNPLAYVLGAAGLAAFLLLAPKVKALVACIFMTQLFDVGPNLILGYYAWDYGAAMMLLLAVQVYMMAPRQRIERHGYLLLVWAMLAWIIVCVLWSLLSYRYPLLNTIKVSRRMVIGYLLVPIFLRLFAVAPDSFDFLLKWFYRITFVLMPVVLLQYVLQRKLLNGLFQEYQGSLRAVPIFLPLCLLNAWIILVRMLSGQKAAFLELLYLALALATVALSFTRGIYLAFLLVAGLMAWTMFRDETLKAAAISRAALLAVPLLLVLLVTPMGSRVLDRTLNAVQLVGTGGPPKEAADDSFHGRLGLAGERFRLATERNPLFGFGFIHEDDVPDDLRAGLKYGTVLSGTAADPLAYARRYATSTHYTLGLYSADIAWADIAICTGLVGIALLLGLFAALGLHYSRHRDFVHPSGYAVRLGAFLQLVMLALLMLDGDSFFASVHVPAFLLVGLALAGPALQVTAAQATVSAPGRPANLMA